MRRPKIPRNSRASATPSTTFACDQALDQIEDLVLRQTREDALPLLDEALNIATDQQRPRLDFLRVRILWPTQREEALEILRPYEDRDDLPPLSLLSSDPTFSNELDRHGLYSLAAKFNAEPRRPGPEAYK